MTDMIKIAENAKMIVNGYAFTVIPTGIQVVNLSRKTACVFDSDDNVIESSMDDIEIEIVADYLRRNKMFLED